MTHQHSSEDRQCVHKGIYKPSRGDQAHELSSHLNIEVVADWSTAENLPGNMNQVVDMELRGPKTRDRLVTSNLWNYIHSSILIHSVL